MFEKRYWSSCLKSYGVVVKRMENTKYINLNAEQLRSKNAFALNIIIINSLIANANGKNSASNTLKDIRTEGCTNIWDGIKIGLELTKDERCYNKNTFVILLTDGEPNVNPP